MVGHRWSRRLMRGTTSTTAVVVLMAVLATAALASRDGNPPTFAGLKSATTCIPGPIRGQTTSYHLSWDQATDDVTPSAMIVYDIYQATKTGGEDFSSPTYTVRHGATTFTTSPLPADQTFYFVVRARDRAGNSDSNMAEQEGVNICA